MRMPALISLLAVLGVTGAAGAEARADLDRLERAWHQCVREAYARQPHGQSRAGDERNALDECKGREDAYVAAVMAARPGDDDLSLRARARAWVASVAASVVDPVADWLARLQR